MAEAAGIAARFADAFHGLPADLDDGAYDHLCYPVAGVQGLFFLAEIDQNDFELAAVIGVDRSGRIQTGDAGV